MKLVKPPNWQHIPLAQLLEFVTGGDWGKDENFVDENYALAYCIRGSEIKKWEDEKGKTSSLRKIKKSSIESRKLKEGDILVEISGGGPEQPVGRTILIDKSALIFEPSIPKICTNFLRLIRPGKEIDSKFLNLYLKLFYYSGEIVKYQGGSNNLRNLKFPDFVKIEIPLPPLTEQQVIVSKIEELLSDLDNGKQQLQIAQQQLKVYRQSLLKWAFEGRLTADWRKLNSITTGQDVLTRIDRKRTEILNNLISKGNKESSRIISKIKKHKFNNPENIQIPKEWCWSSFLNSCYLVVDCHNKTAPYQNSGIYLIRTSNVKNGKLLLNEKIKFVSDDTYNYWSRRCPPVSGDILFTREAPMGEAAIIPIDIKVCMGQRIMLLRTFPELLLPKYLHYAIMESCFQQRMNNNAIGTGVKHLRVGDVEELVFPICSMEEQQLIIDELESKLTVCDKIEETIIKSLLQAETLRQSILKKAFEGKLI